eukprot:TRINITY_DN9456_c0_g1_i2.p1 TRINITY_DN9456_c0_g1~~TRINITY_DN9456_c0_g1_i2.p1  ORF type:complete len:595 (-),score=131.01 TRINITY_DN9456_c0_g1_i2:63-1847(-)
MAPVAAADALVAADEEAEAAKRLRSETGRQRRLSVARWLGCPCGNAANGLRSGRGRGLRETFRDFRALAARWYSVALLLLVASSLHADQNLAAPNLSAIAADFELDALDKDKKLGGQVQLGFFFIGGATSLAMGPLADKTNRMNLLLLVVLTGSLPCLLIYQVPSGVDGFFWYQISRMFTGISVGGSFPLLYSLCGDLCQPDQRAAASAAMSVATAVGVACGQLLAGFLGPRLGWRAPFVAVAVPALGAVSMLWVTVPEPLRSSGRRQRLDTPPDEELGPLPSKLAGASSADVDGDGSSTASGSTSAADRRRTGGATVELEAQVEASADDPGDDDLNGHGSVTDCGRFGAVYGTMSNRLLLGQAIPGCVAWSTVTTFIPDYLHSEQGLCVESATLLVSLFGVACLVCALGGAAFGQRVLRRRKEHVSYLMAACTALAVGPFLLLINASPESLQGQRLASLASSPSAAAAAAAGSSSSSGGERLPALPSLWACAIAMLGGVAAVTNPNVKALLMTVNTSHTRGTAFAVATLTDDVGKGLGPEIVSLGIALVGRRMALSMAMGCWFLSSILLYCTQWTLKRDMQRVERLENLPHDV